MKRANCLLPVLTGLIPPPEIMITWAVFYDEIWLPCPYEWVDL